MFSNREVTLLPAASAMNLNNHHSNSEWRVDSSSVEEEIIEFGGNYTSHRYCIRLSRRVTFYTYALLTPCVLLWLLSLLVFLIPPQSGEKLTLGEIKTEVYTRSSMRIQGNIMYLLPKSIFINIINRIRLK